MYQLFDTRFVVGVGSLYLALCNDAADGHGFVSHEEAEASDGATFHLVVGDALSLIAEVGDEVVDLFDRQIAAEYTTLRAIETVGSNGATTHHVVTCYAVDKFGISRYHVWACRFGRIVDEIHERVLKAEVSYLVTTFIESQNLDSLQIVLFCTSGGSPAAPSMEALRRTYPNLRFEDALLLNNIDADGLISPDTTALEAQ